MEDAKTREKWKVVAKSGGKAGPQAMGNFKADSWSGPAQPWWTGTKVGSHGVFSLTVDRTPGVQGIDLYDPRQVVTRGRYRSACAGWRWGSTRPGWWWRGRARRRWGRCPGWTMCG